MTKFILTILFPLAIFLSNCGQTSSQGGADQQIIRVQTDTCDNPDADINCCFVNMPATLTSIMTIAKQNEPGDKLIITGTVFKPDGMTPYPDVILYAYHTDHAGHYSKKGNETGFQKWHGHLHGWCKTDSNGHYEIHSIRPARYPGNSIPAHIHAAIKTDNRQMFYITDYVFKDDSLVNEKYLLSPANIGGTGVVDIKKISGNIWTGKRDIILRK
ncbi:MAG TPA: intradiol ring-cleavage dioxygenase [Bacteroidia bacterium]|nr:intradiol ring-cleavage dioxygenase [Bacteroidia bacterium]